MVLLVVAGSGRLGKHWMAKKLRLVEKRTKYNHTHKQNERTRRKISSNLFFGVK